MALDQLDSFLGSINKTDAAAVKAALASSKAGDKLDKVADALASVGKAKGFSFDQAEMKEHMSALKQQYYTNTTVKLLMDSYCSTSCHIGSQLTGTSMHR